MMTIRSTIMNSQIAVLIVIIFLWHGVSAQNKGGRWEFEMNGNDTADWDQTDNQGSLSGNANYGNDGTAPDGNFYLALEDTNRHDHFYVPDNYELDMGNGDIALSAWIYPLAITSKPQYILVKGDHEAVPRTNNYALRLAGENLSLNVADADGIATKVVSSFTIQTNQWNFVAAFYDYSNSVAYLWNAPNGPPVDTLFFNPYLYVNNSRLYIGSWGSEGYRKFTGRIDDVRIGTRVEEIISTTTDVRDETISATPKLFRLQQNYPNPFNPETIIAFDLLRNEYVSLDVYNILGWKVATLVDQKMNAGSYTLPFNAADLPSGFYFYRLLAGHENEVKRMVLIK